MNFEMLSNDFILRVETKIGSLLLETSVNMKPTRVISWKWACPTVEGKGIFPALLLVLKAKF